MRRGITWADERSGALVVESVALNPREWPREVSLSDITAFPAINDGKQRGLVAKYSRRTMNSGDATIPKSQATSYQGEILHFSMQ